MRAAHRLWPLIALSTIALTPAASTATPRTLDRCIQAGAQTAIVSVAAAGGDAIQAALLGRANEAVVFANESDLDLCAWLPFARTLAHSGYRAVLFDYARDDPWTEVAAVVGAVRKLGAKRVVVLGASEGA
jgi:hypothetical protein